MPLLTRSFVIGSIGTFVALTPALASGGFNCTADDKSVSFTAQAVVSHGVGEVFTNFSATLDVKAKGLPNDLAKQAFDASTLIHHWYFGNELKLRLYRERTGEPHGSVDLVIETKRRPKDETEYVGRYQLTIFEVGAQGAEDKERKFKGRVVCSAE